MTFLQCLLPLTLTAFVIAVGEVKGANGELNHGLPEYPAASS
jgi:hypothetical protein